MSSSRYCKLQEEVIYIFALRNPMQNCKLQEYMAYKYYNRSTGTQPDQQGEAETLLINKYNVLTKKDLSKKTLKHSIVVSHWQLYSLKIASYILSFRSPSRYFFQWFIECDTMAAVYPLPPGLFNGPNLRN